MKSRQILFGEQARSELIEGCRILYNAVSSTMGPGGRTVVIREGEEVRATKDGVSVAKQVYLEGFKDIGAQILKQASMRTGDTAGDGTTSAVVLAYTIIDTIFSHLKEDHNLIDIKNGILAASQKAIEKLKTISRPLDDQDARMLEHIGTISANGDDQIGQLVAEVISRVGIHGSVLVKDSYLYELKVEYSKGYEIPTTPLSFKFIDHGSEKSSYELKDVFIMFYHGTINDADNIANIATSIAQNNSFLIIADDVESKAMDYLMWVRNNTNNRVIVIRSPHNGPYRKAILGDLALLTGGSVINARDKNINLAGMKDKLENYLGYCTKAVVSKTSTILSGFPTDEKIEKAVEVRAKSILESVDQAENAYSKDRYIERYAKLSGNLATIHVGAPSDIELYEKKDRIDDAICAVRSAMEEGIVPGCGITYRQLVHFNKFPESVSDSYKYGYNMFVNAMGSIFIHVLRNANLHPDQYRGVSVDQTVNARTGEVVNAFEEGIVDPAKVVREVISNAASVASTLLTTQAVIDSSSGSFEDISDDMIDLDV